MARLACRIWLDFEPTGMHTLGSHIRRGNSSASGKPSCLPLVFMGSALQVLLALLIDVAATQMAKAARQSLLFE